MNGKSVGLLAVLMICACQAALAGGATLFRGVADVPAQEGPTGVQVDPGVARSDVALAIAVKENLSSSSHVNSGRIVVFASEGTVTLNGMVQTPAAKSDAEYLARRARGTTRVINNLRVKGRVD